MCRARSVRRAARRVAADRTFRRVRIPRYAIVPVSRDNVGRAYLLANFQLPRRAFVGEIGDGLRGRRFTGVGHVGEGTHGI